MDIRQALYLLILTCKDKNCAYHWTAIGAINMQTGEPMIRAGDRMRCYCGSKQIKVISFQQVA